MSDACKTHSIRSNTHFLTCFMQLNCNCVYSKYDCVVVVLQMNPDVSVVVPAQPATQAHTLLSPQQFSLTETTPPPSHSNTPPPSHITTLPPSHVTLPPSHVTVPPPPPPGLDQSLLSREQFKQTLLYLIQVHVHLHVYSNSSCTVTCSVLTYVYI